MINQYLERKKEEFEKVTNTFKQTEDLLKTYLIHKKEIEETLKTEAFQYYDGNIQVWLSDKLNDESLKALSKNSHAYKHIAASTYLKIASGEIKSNVIYESFSANAYTNYLEYMKRQKD
jgi:uncharacterized protein YjaZ